MVSKANINNVLVILIIFIAIIFCSLRSEESYERLAKERIDYIIIKKRNELISYEKNLLKKTKSSINVLNLLLDTARIYKFSRDLDSISNIPFSEDMYKPNSFRDSVDILLNEIIMFAINIGKSRSNKCNDYLTEPISYAILISYILKKPHPYYSNNISTYIDNFGNVRYIKPFCSVLKEQINNKTFLKYLDSCSLTSQEKAKILSGELSYILKAHFGDTIAENKIIINALSVNTYDEKIEKIWVLKETNTKNTITTLVSLLNKETYKEDIVNPGFGQKLFFRRRAIQYDIIKQLSRIYPDEELFSCELRKAHFSEISDIGQSSKGSADTIKIYYQKVYAWAYKYFNIRLYNLNKIKYLERYDTLTRKESMEYFCRSINGENKQAYYKCIEEQKKAYKK